MMKKINFNQFIITTKFVIHDNSIITRVIHDDEGDWQFLGSEKELKDSDAIVLTLEEILKHDPTLHNIINLDRGKQAFRTSTKSQWEVCDFEYIEE